MDRHPLPLRARSTAASGGTHAGERIGLGGALAAHGRIARPARAPGSAVEAGWRWDLRDRWSGTWWPQGIAVGEHEGIPVALVSWYAQERRGRRMGSRLTVVDLRDERRPRYRHVLLVVPEADGLATVPIHAGGLAWAGDRLYVAATFGGIREFRLDDLAHVAGRGPFGYRLVLPQHAEYSAAGEREERLRYSFVSAAAPGELVAGEYRTDPEGRLALLRVGDERAEAIETWRPGIVAMQGAVLRDGVWTVSASRGERDAGDLWHGPAGALRRVEGALPPGPEDVAVDAAGRLWGVSEFPRRRWLYRLRAMVA